MAFVYRSWNRVKFPAIGTIVIGVVDIASLIWICEFTSHDNAMIVLIINAIFSVLQCFVLNAIVVGDIYKDCRGLFAKISLKITVSFLLCFICGRLICSWIQINNLLQLGVVLMIAGIIMLNIVLFAVLNREERIKLFSIVK